MTERSITQPVEAAGNPVRGRDLSWFFRHVEQYLADQEEPSLEVKLLVWWAAKQQRWPNLAKMAKQYLAAPRPPRRASSGSSPRRARCTAETPKK